MCVETNRLTIIWTYIYFSIIVCTVHEFTIYKIYKLKVMVTGGNCVVQVNQIAITFQENNSQQQWVNVPI